MTIAKGGYVYIMSNKTRSTFYIGVTSNLLNRVYEHKEGIGSSFTAKYNCHYLIYYEFHECIVEAITREKRMKKWNRAWKERLIDTINPSLRDLSNEIEGFD